MYFTFVHYNVPISQSSLYCAINKVHLDVRLRLTEHLSFQNNQGWYLFRGPSDHTVTSFISFTIETNGVSVTERTILVRWKSLVTSITPEC